MKRNFFSNISTIEELKKEYRRLAIIHHPDRGGDAEIMKALNVEYDEVLKELQGESGSSRGSDTDEFKEILNKVITLEVDIEVCGSWIWISGNTKPYKKELKEFGFWWASKKQMWYWHPEEEKKRRKSDMTIDKIREKYGSEKVKNKEKKAIA